MKTRDQVERDTNALIKYMLGEMEELAAQMPEEALEPYSFDVRRRTLVKKLWGVVREALAHDASSV